MGRGGFNPNTISDATAQYSLGEELLYLGCAYRYYLNSDQATVAGDAMRYTATVSTANGGTAPTVNRRLVATGGTPASVSNLACAGIAVGVVGAGAYGFFLVRGYCAVVGATAGMLAGVVITTSTATDAITMATAAATSKSCGVSITATAGGFCTAYIEI